jgi:hypothetical protein
MNYFQTTAKYVRDLPEGRKKVTDHYLVDALSCTEAEMKTEMEIKDAAIDGYQITSVKEASISEVFRDEFAASDDTCEKWYLVKVAFISIDERTATEKRTISNMMVQSDSFDGAVKRFKEGMKGTMADYEIAAVSETSIIDVIGSDTDVIAAELPIAQAE